MMNQPLYKNGRPEPIHIPPRGDDFMNKNEDGAAEDRHLQWPEAPKGTSSHATSFWTTVLEEQTAAPEIPPRAFQKKSFRDHRPPRLAVVVVEEVNESIKRNNSGNTPISGAVGPDCWPGAPRAATSTIKFWTANSNHGDPKPSGRSRVLQELDINTLPAPAKSLHCVYPGGI